MKPLTLIGEKINYSIPRIGKMLDAGDLDGVCGVARMQEERGADYLDVNVGPHPPVVMRDVVRAVQAAVSVPLCIDSADPAVLEAGADEYEAHRKPGTRGPILNSAVESNADRVLALKSRFDCRVVLLVSERLEGGVLRRNVLPEEMIGTARRLFAKARGAGFGPDEILVDPGTPSISSDLDGLANAVLDAIAGLRADAELRGCHLVVGVSNFTAGLPKPARLPLENAFLTLAVRNGLDTVIGDPSKEYRILDPGDESLVWLERILAGAGSQRLEALASNPLYRGGVRDGREGPD